MLLPASTTEAQPSVPGLSVGSNLSSLVRHQSGGLLQRITSGSTSEADGPTTESLQCSRPLAASCSPLRPQSTRASQRSASLAVYARESDIQGTHHGVQVLALNGLRHLNELCVSVRTDAYRSHLRSADKTELKVPRHKLPTEWNSFPCHRRNEKLTLEQFTSGLKTHLFRVS